MKIKSCFFLIITCTFGVIGHLHAASGIWTNTASGGLWGAGANWQAGVVADGLGSAVDFSTIDITADNTVHLDSSRTSTTLLFGDTITNTTASWSLDNNGVAGNILTLAGTTPTITVNALGGGKVVTLGPVIAGSAGLTKTGNGTLVLTNANTLTGGVTVGKGNLTLDFTAGATTILPLQALTLSGGTLNIIGNATTPSSQTFSGTTFSSGVNVVSAAPASGANNPTLALGGLTDTAGATVEFMGPAYDSGATGAGVPVAATAAITTGAGGTGTLGLLVSGGAGYATVNQYDWASTDTTGDTAGTTIIGGSQVPGFYTVQNGGTIPNTAGNYDITASSQSMQSGTTAAFTLRFNTAAAVTFTVRNNVNLQGFQGALVTPNVGANNVTFVPQTSSVGRGLDCQTANNFMFWQNNTLGEVIFNNNGTTVTWLGGGSASGNYIQNGPGTVVMNVTSQGIWTTGNAFLNGGVTQIAGNTQINNETAGSTVTLNGGTLVANYTGTMNLNAAATAHPIALGANGGGLGATAGNTFTVPGVISGAAGTGPLVIGIPASANNGNVLGRIPGTGTGTANTAAVLANGIVALTGANTYSGNTIISSGTLQLGATSSINNSTNIIVSGGTIYDVSLVSGYTLGASQSQNLMGSGSLNGAVSVASGSAIFGGTDGTYGTNTFNNNLVLSAGALAYFDLSVNSGDEIVVNGNLSLTNTAIHLKAPGISANLAPGDYILFTNTAGTLTVNGVLPLVWDVPPVNSASYVLVTTGNAVVLHYTLGGGPFVSVSSASPNPAYPNQGVLISATVLTNGATLNKVTANVSAIAGVTNGVTTNLQLFLSTTANVYTNSITVGASVPTNTTPSFSVTAVDYTAITNIAANTLSVIYGNPVIVSTIANPNPVVRGVATIIAATVTNRSYPVIKVTVGGNVIVGSPVSLVLSNGNVYTNTITVTNTAPAGATNLIVTAVDTGNETNTAIFSLNIVSLAGVTNLPASNVQGTLATLNGQIVSIGGQTPSVTVYYGTSDGGTNVAAWVNNAALGPQSGTFATNVAGLSPNTTYFFAAQASNNAGISWAAPSKNFTTLTISPPIVTNLPASNVQGTTATLNGLIVSTGNQAPTITLYYGPSNGGTNPAAWANSINLGQKSGNYATTVVGLSTNTTYYYAAAATNSAGLVWAQPALSFTTPASGLVSVLTFHYDNTCEGANINETLLTPANVNTNTFGKLFSQSVDGYVYAQPLIVPNLAIPGQGVHDVVFVATENNTVYAFDADGNGGAGGGLLWSNHLAPAVPYTIVGGKPDGDMNPSSIGIHGTPVIDPVSGTIYMDVDTVTNIGGTNIFNHLIHALNITTGNDQSYSPVVVAATCPGTASDGNGSVVHFVAQQHSSRPAMTLAGGVLYASYGSYQDIGTYHGWIIGYNPTNLVQLTNYVFNASPNGNQSALWGGGGGLVVDANTNLYFQTANGPFDVNTGGPDYGDSVVKLTTTNGLAVGDYFTPYNQLSLANNDSDLGSGAPVMLGDSAGSAAHPHLLLGAGKQGTLYLMDRDNLGQYNGTDGINGSDSQIIQSVVNGISSGYFNGSHGQPAYWNNRIYTTAMSAHLKAWSITNAVINTSPQQSPSAFGKFTGTPIVSANGMSNGIAWVLDPGAYATQGAMVLHAYNATNLSQELYNSSQLSTRDNPGGAVKMTAPVVANGKVYVGAEFQLSVFGLTTYVATPIITPNGGNYTNSTVVTISDATSGATNIYYTLDGTVPTTNSPLYTGPFVINTTLNVSAIAVKAGSASGVAAASFVNSAVVGNGSGLLGQYWTNTTATLFTNVAFATAATLTRTDAVVNFNWTTNGPDPSIGRTNYTVRWTGAVQPQYNETYTFTTVADDGVRLWVNGQLLVNNWTAHTSAATNSGTITLNSQQLYNLRLDYFQNTSNAVAQLYWSSPSTAQAIVPQTQLYPYANPAPTVILSSPVNNSTYTAAASVTIGANADAPYNPVSAVSFYANNAFLGSVTNLPYTLTATGLAAGGYALTAVAVDGSGLSSTSAPINITVNPGSGLTYGLTTNPPVGAFLNMPTTSSGTLPPLLSQTGAFSNTTNRTPSGGLIPYVPNEPQWKDNAVGSWFMALPGGQIQFAPTNAWTFPAGTVFVKNFDMVVNQTNTGVPLRRLETQLLVRDINGSVYGASYKWRPDDSDADLLATGVSEDIYVTNATGISTQTWYYTGPADCLECHNTAVANNASGINVLGVNARQLNGSLTYPATGVTDNQLRTLNRLGLFYPAFDEATITNIPHLSAMTNVSAPLQDRVRSYLDVNCEQCHQPGGQGPTWDARYDTPLAQQNITNFPATFSLGISDNACIIKAQDIWRSVIYDRINTVDQDIQMPDFRNLIDTNGVAVMAAWINSLPGLAALAPPAITPSGGTFSPSVTVTLTPPDGTAQLYYTLNGTLPTTNSFLYVGPFTLTNGATFVMANAFETNYNNSIAVSAFFTVAPLYFTTIGFLPGGQFQLGVVGVASNTYVLEASTNLINWIPLSTNTAATNQFYLSDPGASNFPSRFYRTLQQ